MFKQFMLAAGLTLAGSVASHAMPATPINGGHYNQLSAFKTTNTGNTRESQPAVNVRIAMVSNVWPRHSFGWAKETNLPSEAVGAPIRSSNTANYTNRSFGFSRKTSLPPKTANTFTPSSYQGNHLENQGYSYVRKSGFTRSNGID